MRPPRFLWPDYVRDLPIRESLPWEGRYGPALLPGVAADENPIDGLGFCSEILDIGVARDGATHGLPVGDDHRWSLNDRPSPTKFLRSAKLDSAGVEGYPPGLNLLDGHAAVLRFPSEIVSQLN